MGSTHAGCAAAGDVVRPSTADARPQADSPGCPPGWADDPHAPLRVAGWHTARLAGCRPWLAGGATPCVSTRRSPCSSLLAGELSSAVCTSVPSSWGRSPARCSWECWSVRPASPSTRRSRRRPSPPPCLPSATTWARSSSRAFRSDGFRQVSLATISCVLALLGAVVVAEAFGYGVGWGAGLLAGGLTQSSVIGVSSAAIETLPGVSPEQARLFESQIAVAFSVCYLVSAAAGAYFLSVVAPRLLGVRDLPAAARQVERRLGINSNPDVTSAYYSVVRRAYRLEPSHLIGRTVHEAELDARARGHVLVLHRVRRDGRHLGADAGVRAPGGRHRHGEHPTGAPHGRGSNDVRRRDRRSRAVGLRRAGAADHRHQQAIRRPDDHRRHGTRWPRASSSTTSFAPVSRCRGRRPRSSRWATRSASKGSPTRSSRRPHGSGTR